MGKRVSMRHKRKAAPEWVFPWRRTGESRIARGFAILFVGAGFAFLLTSVRIRVSPPTPWAAHKASVILVGDDADGRALTLRAKEGGPFPSRFVPSEWEGAVALERAAAETTRWTPPPYVPVLRDLPDEATGGMRLASRGEPVFPERPRPPAVAPSAVTLKPTPFLQPLSGISSQEMPGQLPAFEGAVDDSMASESWRFLLRLDAGGNVQECVNLAGGDEAGPSPMENWLRRVSFNAKPGSNARWISVSVGFTNQPANGPDAR